MNRDAVEGMMANIAVVFHGWTPDMMDEWSVPELQRWHTLAMERSPKGKK